LGSAIFAFLAVGAFPTIEAAQKALCPAFRTVEPDPAAAETYSAIYGHYRKLYFALGQPDSELGKVLPALRDLSRQSARKR
jgi:L-ribulokinase